MKQHRKSQERDINILDVLHAWDKNTHGKMCHTNPKNRKFLLKMLIHVLEVSLPLSNYSRINKKDEADLVRFAF